MAKYCPKNEDPKGGHYYVKIGGRWVCEFCKEPERVK